MNTADYRRLVALGLTPEQVAGVMEMFDERDEDRKAQGRARWKRWDDKRKATSVSQRKPTTANGSRAVEDKPLTQKIEPQENKKRAEDALRSEFEDEFWPIWPNKVGKPKALVAFRTARKQAELSVILDGVRRYVASKPADRAWLNPATFLNQERFNDQPATVVPMARGSPRRNPLMDRLNELTRPPNDDDPQPSQAAVLQLPATAYR